MLGGDVADPGGPDPCFDLAASQPFPLLWLSQFCNVGEHAEPNTGCIRPLPAPIIEAALLEHKVPELGFSQGLNRMVPWI